MKKEAKKNHGHVIDIKGLNKSFGENHVLKDINLQLSPDENLVILGRSGMGKSVLIKCIVGLEDLIAVLFMFLVII